MAARFVLSRSGSQFRFVLKTGNNETILTSELYNAKGSAEDGIESVKKNSALDERYERKDSSNGKPTFNLKASNGQVIGTSELYSSESARDGGIASVKANGTTATVDDQT